MLRRVANLQSFSPSPVREEGGIVSVTMRASVFHYDFVRALDILSPLIGELDEIFREPLPLYGIGVILLGKFPVLMPDVFIGIVS